MQAQGKDGRIHGFSLMAMVPAVVVIAAVAVLLAIGLVVLVVITQQIPEGKAVVAGDEVDTLLRIAHAGLVDIRAADQATGQTRDHAIVPLDQAADIVAELAVPLTPT